MLQQRFKELKRDLTQRKRNIERLEVDRNFELSSEELALSEAVPVGSVLKVVLGDCTLAVTETIAGNFLLLPYAGKASIGEQREGIAAQIAAIAFEKAAKGKFSMAEEAAKYASLLGACNLEQNYKAAAMYQRQMQSDRLQQLLPDAIHEQLLLEKCLKAGTQAKNIGNYRRELEKFLRSKALLEQLSAQSQHLSWQLGTVFSYFARWEEAETQFKMRKSPIQL